VHLLLAAAAQAAAPQPLDQGQWITADDYPPAARRHDQAGTVGYVVKVDSSGSVTECTISRSSGVAALDLGTCALLTERARFAPASDASGRAAAGEFSSQIKWALPAAGRVPLTPWSQASRLVIARDGEVRSCHTTSGGEVPAEAGDLCRVIGGFPREVRLSMRHGAETDLAVVVAETSMTFDSAELPAARQEPPRRRLISLISSRFDIDEAGEAENCRIVAREGLSFLQPDLCAKMFDGSFIPDRDANGAPRRRKATVVISIALEAGA
jgi:protein TonB